MALKISNCPLRFLGRIVGHEWRWTGTEWRRQGPKQRPPWIPRTDFHIAYQLLAPRRTRMPPNIERRPPNGRLAPVDETQNQLQPQSQTSRLNWTYVYSLWDDAAGAEGNQARQEQAEGPNKERHSHQQEEDLGIVIGGVEDVSPKVIWEDSDNNSAEDLRVRVTLGNHYKNQIGEGLLTNWANFKRPGIVFRYPVLRTM